MFGAQIVPYDLPLGKLEIVADQFCTAALLSCDVVICCTPNNPTGVITPLSAIKNFRSQFDGLLLIDEAYMEYANLLGYESSATFACWRKEHNLPAHHVKGMGDGRDAGCGTCRHG